MWLFVVVKGIITVIAGHTVCLFWVRSEPIFADSLFAGLAQTAQMSFLIVGQTLFLLHPLVTVLPEVEWVELATAVLTALLESFPWMGRHPCLGTVSAFKEPKGLRVRHEVLALQPFPDTAFVGGEIGCTYLRHCLVLYHIGDNLRTYNHHILISIRNPLTKIRISQASRFKSQRWALNQKKYRLVIPFA